MCRGKKELTICDRYLIEKCLNRKMSHKDIADTLGVSRQCIDYEVRKGMVFQRDTHLNDVYVYKADYAQMLTDKNKKNTGVKLRFSENEELMKSIKNTIKAHYSPYACIQKLGLNGVISEKTIYNYVRRRLIKGLSWKDMPYMKADKRKFKHEEKLVMPYGKTIDFRPDEVAERSTPLHWEMDTVYSAKGSLPCLLTMTERKTLLEVIKPMRNRTQASLSIVWRLSQKDMEVKNFKEVFKSITVDNGMEFRDFDMIEKSIYSGRKVTSVYFAHPYRSGERGSNENQNRMIRRRIPKGDNIGLYSLDEIREYTHWLNTYPRKKFNGKSSFEMMCEEYRVGNISQNAFKKLMKLACCDCETLPIF